MARTSRSGSRRNCWTRGLATREVKTEIIPLGSGEGISHVYMKHPPKLVGRRSRKEADEDSELIG